MYLRFRLWSLGMKLYRARDFDRAADCFLMALTGCWIPWTREGK